MSRPADRDDGLHAGLLQASGLAGLSGVRHAFETRQGDLLSALPGPLLRLRQVHGAEVLLVDASTDLEPLARPRPEDRPAADALVTALPGHTLAVATADCLPVLLADADTGVVAAAHAGWRGIALGVLPATLAVMAREHGARPERCRAAIGPCIGADSYRVGSDVRTAFLAAGVPASVFRAAHDGDGHGEWSCDLLAAARSQLRACGVPGGAIDTAGGCTFSSPARFHSYRRDGETAGRMHSGIALGD